MMHGFGLSSVFMWLIGAVVVFAFSGILIRWFRGQLSQHRKVPTNGGHREGQKSEADIYRLARKLGGYLTVSDVVIHLGYSTRQAENLLEKMTDGLRIRMEVNDNGLIVYEFSELIYALHSTTSHDNYNLMTIEKDQEEENHER
jgi:hypothetical protein